MKFGMPTLIEFGSVEECAEYASRLGLDFVEINMSFPNYNVDSLDVESLNAIAKKYGVFYTFHAEETLNPFDFTKCVSECYLEVTRRCIRIAKAVGAPLINMHLQKGVYATLPDKVVLLYEAYIDTYLQRVRDFIRVVEEEIGESDLKITIENVDTTYFLDFQLKSLELFMNSRVFALTLDVGHDCCLEGKDRHVFEKYKDRLMHMHLHDSDGSHAHLPLGEGVIDVPITLSMLKPDATCLIEVKTAEGLDISVKYLKEMRA